MQIENFKNLLEGNDGENINIDVLFEEFKFLFTSAHKDFIFDLGDTWLDGDYLKPLVILNNLSSLDTNQIEILCVI